MTIPARPMLTIGIPLHASRPFVDTVSANIDAVRRDDVEILLSDRTGLDDALDVLACRHRDDPRVTLVRASDGANWVDHCNALLGQARGTYFCWMPHDDHFESSWVHELLGTLESESDLLMAFGRIEPVSLDGAPLHGWDPVRLRHPPAGTGRGEWTVRDAVGVLTRWNGGIAFRGMFRRAPVLAHGLLLPTTRDCMSADIAWVFGMALLGRLRFVPEAVCRKRYYAESTSTGWKPRPAHRLSLVSTLVRYARSYAGSTRATAVALAGIARVTLASLIAGPVRRRRVRRLMRRAAADSA